MPDAGDFNKDLSAHGAHTDWAGAFAAMPLQTPPADGWQRLQARLPAGVPTRNKARWPLGLATAASLALVVAIPLRMQSTKIPLPGPSASVATTPSGPSTTQPAVDVGAETISLPVLSAAMQGTHNPASMPSPATTASTNKPRRGRHVDPSQQPIRTAAQPLDTTRLANTESPGASVAGSNLDSLYAQSAQLESLLAFARDDRVASGATATLIDTLDAQVASIDAALIQPDVIPQRRTELWRNRVDTLRQLVGIETTQRLYSARGLQYEAALVSID
ncbi:hypothetical protein [Thermomonas sp.]